MSKLYSRMRGAIRRNIYSRKKYYNPESYEEEEADAPERMDEAEVENTNYIRRNQNTPPRTRARERAVLDEGPPAAPASPPSPEVRPAPEVIQPAANVDPPVAPNPVPAPTPLLNPTQPLSPLPNRAPQSSTRTDFPFLRERKRRPFIMNPNSQLVGFPRSEHFLPASSARPAFNSRPAFPSHFRPPPPRPRPNISHHDFDYPIQNGFINENIPPSMPTRINNGVQHNRFGNSYHTPHHASKPKTHYIPIDTNRHLECRLVENDSQMDVRYTYEIDYPQRQALNNIQLVIDNTPSLPELNYFPMPIHHFTAHALPNDPMRYY